jgi:hypothetical protein
MGTLHEFPNLGADSQGDDRAAEIAFGFMMLLLWACSAVRVVLAAEGNEVFGAEASLALVCTLAIPWVALRTRPGRRVAVHVSPRPAEGRSSPKRHLRIVAGSRRRG